MKRVIKIILILLVAFLLVLAIVWLIRRHKTSESKTGPLTFKQFLGLGTKANVVTPAPGESSSDFGTLPTGGTNGTGAGTGNNATGSQGNNGGNTDVSQFTNEGINPSDNTGANFGAGSGGNYGNSGANSGSSETSGTDTENNDSTADQNNSSSDTDNAPICGTADTTITFTTDEITQLNSLQNQFYTLAQTLHTDADAQTELANHDAFEIRAEQDTELYNSCEAMLPAITEPQLEEHVATPFWEAWNDTVDARLGDPSISPPNPLWTSSTNPIKQDAPNTLSYVANYNNSNIDTAHLADVHDNGNDGSNSDTSGIKGPYGLLSFSDPTAVSITGSVVKNNSTTSATLFGIKLPNPFGLPTPSLPTIGPKFLQGPLGTKTIINNSDFQLLVPVVDKILRINLW